MKKVLAAIITLVGFSTVSNAQTSATTTTTASATIVAPIQIAKGSDDMNFGLIASSVSGGTVILSPAVLRTPSGVTLLTSTTVSPSVPQFTVTGTPGYVYDIAAIPTVTLTQTTGTATMTVDNFTTSLSPNEYQSTLTSGTSIFTLGGTLNIGANQAAGVYESGNFDVTVSYN